MDIHYTFQIKHGSTPNQALREAHEHGLKDIYTIQDIHEDKHIIGGSVKKKIDDNFIHLSIAEIYEDINWADQSRLFSPYYINGQIVVPLSEFSSTGQILLEPGAGFGDLSHPTTKLCMNTLSLLCKDKNILDIGCGNGVLSIGASIMGAATVYGLDIDPQAIVHANRNKELNDCKNVTFFHSSDCMPLPCQRWTAIMNMTFYEQKKAWDSLVFWHDHIDTILISGILKEKKASFITWAKSMNWLINKEKELEGWLCFQIEK